MKGLFQCPPWARSFWAFSPYLNHMRNFSILKKHHVPHHTKKSWWASSDEGHQLCPATHSDVKVVQKIKGNFVIL